MGLHQHSDEIEAPGERRRFNAVYLQADPYPASLVDYRRKHSPGQAKADDAPPSLSVVCRGSSHGTDNLSGHGLDSRRMADRHCIVSSSGGIAHLGSDKSAQDHLRCW